MAKTALVAGEQSTDRKPNAAVEWATTNYEQAQTFLGDVRGETRKVIKPSRKEVQATTTVVLATVFIFAFYFWIVDSIFTFGLNRLLTQLVGPQ